MLFGNADSLDSNLLPTVMPENPRPPFHPLYVFHLFLTGVQDPNRHWVLGALCVLLLVSGTAGGG